MTSQRVECAGLRHCLAAGGRGACALAALYFVATSLGHLAFTHWLLAPRQILSLAFSWKDFVPLLVLLGGSSLVGWLAWQAHRQRAVFWRVAPYWLLWGASVAAVDRYLTYSVYEYAHYPQYALLSWLVARAVDAQRRGEAAGRVFLWTTFLGMLDELMQYIWITPTYGHYLDFNDFVVNQLAAAAGVMLYYGRGPQALTVESTRVPLRLPWGWLAVLSILTVLGVAAGVLALSPPPGEVVPPGGWVAGGHAGTFYLQREATWYHSWRAGPHRGQYFILPPWAAVLWMLLAARVFGGFPRRLSASVVPLSWGSAAPRSIRR